MHSSSEPEESWVDIHAMLRINGVWKDMNKTAGRELSPDDIVKELAKCAPVPAFAAQAIRRDYLRVSV